MLQTIVNAHCGDLPPYQRAAIVLEQRGRFKLSGDGSHPGQRGRSGHCIAQRNSAMGFFLSEIEVIHVRQHSEEIEGEREETRAKFRKYFAESGMRGFYARPLNDDTGRYVAGCWRWRESSDPISLGLCTSKSWTYFRQATVAPGQRADAAKEVPFISVLEPVLGSQTQVLMAMEKRRRTLISCGAAAIAVLFSSLSSPLPLRVDGDAKIAQFAVPTCPA